MQVGRRLALNTTWARVFPGEGDGKVGEMESGSDHEPSLGFRGKS